MNVLSIRLLIYFCFLANVSGAQPAGRPVPKQFPGRSSPLAGHFLTDSIEIGRPFQYALTYRHASTVDVLFPDTAQSFAPYRVQNVAVFATQTTGTGQSTVSRDSAVYTLVSFETNPVQWLQVPIRIINDIDCTAQWTRIDTVFLRSKLPLALSNTAHSLTLATETNLAPLQQQFNYSVLATGLLIITSVAVLLYGLFGWAISRQWRLYRLNRQHSRFLRDYNRLSLRLTSYTAAETANQAVVMWKTYLEVLDRQPYTSLTTSEIAERMNDEHIADALREADRMIYGGTFSDHSALALRVLSNVATQAYRNRRATLQASAHQPDDSTQETDSADYSSYS